MREYLLVLFVAAATTYLLGGAVGRLAHRLGAVKVPGRDRDVHSRPTPELGGLAMLGGLAAAFLVATRLPFLGSLPDVGRDVGILLLAGVIITVVGAIDDLVDLDALTRVAGEVLAGGVIVVFGVQLYWLPLPDGTTFSLSPALGAAITVLGIVAVANAVNFVDGLDGLAAGVVCIGAAAFFFYSYLLAYENGLNRATTATLITAALTGVCLGFLPHNFSTARIFMGDSGAYLLGLMLAASTITLTGYLDPGALVGDAQSRTSLLPALLPLILPIAVLALPFVELILTVVRRTRAGRSPFAADRGHLHHRLMDLGHSMTRAVLVMYLWAGLVAFGAVAIGLRTTWVTIGAVGIGLIFAVVLTAMVPRHGLSDGATKASEGDDHETSRS